VEIGNWPTAGYMTELYPELRALGVEVNLAELEAFGFTVLSPQQVNVPGLHQRVLQAVLDVSERRSRVRPDMESGETHRGMIHPLGQIMRFVLWEAQVFEEVLLNPAMLGVVTWLLGPTCILSLCNSMLRGPGNNCVPLHTDEGNRTMPVMPEGAMTVNATFLLTDYTKDGGALAFVPGSHKWRREPGQIEAQGMTKQLIPIEAPAGSFVIWGDHTWHGAFSRRTPGLRGTFFFNFARHTLQTQEPYRDTCTQDALDRNPKRFAVLMDQFGTYPWREEDEDYRRGAERYRYLSLFDRTPTAGTVQLLSERPRRSIPQGTQPTKSPLAAAPGRSPAYVSRPSGRST
jgi:ectoine hydroxylase-related dioxygenase (phytanoyl-CoA dioxygenase family)